MPLPEQIVIPIKTLTPVWTGDADRKTSYIKGTSLLGGLRFWTEALVRSLGKRVCNITDETKDIYDKETGKDICRVCEIFGCTGKGRSFSLRVSGEGKEEGMGEIRLTEYRYEKPHGRWNIPAWFLKDKGKTGNFEIRVMPLRKVGISPELALALVLMLKWGSLGAKDQFGYGLIEATLPKALIELAQAVPNNGKTPYNGLSLQDFFYFTARGENQDNNLPFRIRYCVRQSLRENERLRHYFCGTIMKRDKSATKFNIGMAGNSIRGWGFFPKDGKFSNGRDICLNNLKETIGRLCNENTLLWREFDSERDSAMQGENWPHFLESLLEGGAA